MRHFVLEFVILMASAVSFLESYSNFQEAENTKSSFNPNGRLPGNFEVTKQFIFLSFDNETTFSGIVSLDLVKTEKNHTADQVKVNMVNMSIERITLHEEPNIEFELKDETNGRVVPKSDYHHDMQNEVTTINVPPNVQKLRVVIEYRAKTNTNSKTKWGIYPPANADGLVTQFETMMARTVFPCLDEPRFRAKFRLVVEVPEERFDLVFFNSKLDEEKTNALNSKRKEGKRMFYFKETVSLPTYLLGIVVGNKLEYEVMGSTNHNGIPITVYASPGPSRDSISNATDLDHFLFITTWVINYCEEHFDVKYSVPDKLDIVFIDLIFGAMEHPGLITIAVDYELPRILAVIVHELVHQWTSVLISNEWWSGFWINEGLTTFMAREIIETLISLGHIGIESTSIDFNYYKEPFELVRDVNSLLAKEGLFTFYGIDWHFFQQAANTVSHLHAAMKEQLMNCVGYVIKKRPFSSISTDSFLNEITQCPYSDVDAAEFMLFWLFEDDIPVVRVELSEENPSLATISHTFLCFFKNSTAIECENHYDSAPHFALVFRESNNTILQPVVFIKKNNTQVKLDFDPVEEHPLFFININNRGNFVVRYPDTVYTSFFDWIEADQSELIRKSLKTQSLFVIDMYELASRDIIGLKWLLQLVKHYERLEELGLHLKPLSVFKSLCLEYELLKEVNNTYTENDKKVYHNYLCQLQKTSECNLPQKPDKTASEYKKDDYIFCSNWVAHYGQSFFELLKQEL